MVGANGSGKSTIINLLLRLKDNIALTTKIDELHIYKAVKECGINEFIKKLPDKYDTVIGRNGTSVSCGERQKIALARAIIRDSKILVFDKATSNYDVESEAAVNKFIGEELQGKTAIIISIVLAAISITLQ